MECRHKLLDWFWFQYLIYECILKSSGTRSGWQCYPLENIAFRFKDKTMKIKNKILVAMVGLISMTGCTATQQLSRVKVPVPTKSINIAPTMITLARVTKALTPVVLTLAQPVVISPRIVISQ